jgi:small subunit ribosomal protein S16e
MSSTLLQETMWEGTLMLICDSQAGKGLVKVNGKPLHLLQPEIMRFKVSHARQCPGKQRDTAADEEPKVYEPILLLGTDKLQNLDM